MTSDQGTGVVPLADGRQLGYTAIGPPDAPAVIYCHGFPSAGREVRILEPILEQYAVPARVVAVDRPGFGRSSFQPGRTFLDWPRDVAELADRLGIERFAVLGISGGGPYALACAADPRDRVAAAGVVVGVAPREATGMDRASVMTGPSARRVLRRTQFELAALAFRKGQQDKFVDRSMASMGPVDQAVLARAPIRTWFTELVADSFAQGGRAAAQEAGLYRSAWGFELASLKVDVRLWYAQADETVPAVAGRWLAERIPGSNLTVWPEQGHFSWMLGQRAAEALAGVARPEPPRA